MAKIMIVDDSSFTRSMHKNMLKTSEITICEADCGKSALDQLSLEKPDIVLLDLLMPDMDGMVVLRQITQDSPSVKVVVCSSDKQAARRSDAAEAGAFAFLAKPVSETELLEVLKKAMRGAE
jgi:DNA-binding NarL/FixJ family response regulator